MIEKEDFDQWLAHPVTEYVLKRVGELAEANKQKWISQSWDGGIADQSALIDLRARAEAAKDLSEISFEDIENERERD